MVDWLQLGPVVKQRITAGDVEWSQTAPKAEDGEVTSSF